MIQPDKNEHKFSELIKSIGSIQSVWCISPPSVSQTLFSFALLSLFLHSFLREFFHQCVAAFDSLFHWALGLPYPWYIFFFEHFQDCVLFCQLCSELTDHFLILSVSFLNLLVFFLNLLDKCMNHSVSLLYFLNLLVLFLNLLVLFSNFFLEWIVLLFNLPENFYNHRSEALNGGCVCVGVCVSGLRECCHVCLGNCLLFVHFFEPERIFVIFYKSSSISNGQFSGGSQNLEDAIHKITLLIIEWYWMVNYKVLD